MEEELTGQDAERMTLDCWQAVHEEDLHNQILSGLPLYVCPSIPAEGRVPAVRIAEVTQEGFQLVPQATDLGMKYPLTLDQTRYMRARFLVWHGYYAIFLALLPWKEREVALIAFFEGSLQQLPESLLKDMQQDWYRNIAEIRQKEEYTGERPLGELDLRMVASLVVEREVHPYLTHHHQVHNPFSSMRMPLVAPSAKTPGTVYRFAARQSDSEAVLAAWMQEHRNTVLLDTRSSLSKPLKTGMRTLWGGRYFYEGYRMGEKLPWSAPGAVGNPTPEMQKAINFWFSSSLQHGKDLVLLCTCKEESDPKCHTLSIGMLFRQKDERVVVKLLGQEKSPES